MKKKGVFVAALIFSFTIFGINDAHRTQVHAKITFDAIPYFANIRGFYQETKNSMDMLIFGDSNSLWSINPLMIWKTKGLTSYNLSSSSQTSWQTKMMVKEALKYQKPKLIVIDTNVLFSYFSGKPIRNCYFTNALYPGEQRINLMKMMFALGNDDKKINKNMFHNYVKDVIKIHSKMQFKDTYQYLHGYNLSTRVGPFLDKNYMMNNAQAQYLDFENAQNIAETITIAKRAGCAVLLTRVPGGMEWSNAHSALVQQFALRHKVKFFDMNIKPYQDAIDWNVDSRDNGLHMNVHGAEKVSAMLADYIELNYKLSPYNRPKTERQYRKDLDTYIYEVNKLNQEQVQKDFS